MSNKVNNVTELIGRTPLVELHRFSSEYNIGTPILAKVEFFNPGGSVKDRAAKQMIEDAEKEGRLKEGSTIIEPTSGNTGLGMALVSAIHGYHVVLVMPETMSEERKRLAKGYGAELVLTPGKEGMSGAVKRANELLAKTPNAVILQQFNNKSNPKAHYLTTGVEIWEQSEGKVDVFVAGVGTGGTLIGVAKRLKEKNPDVKIVAVEPASSPVLSTGKGGPHKIQGIGAGFVPGNYDESLVDEVFTVENDQAFQAARLLARKEGLLVGISSGAAAFAAAQLAQREELRGKTIVTLLPDTGERYLSTELFNF